MNPLQPIVINSYPPLWQTLITVLLPLSFSVGLFYLMWKTDFMFDFMDRMMGALGKHQVYSDYQCTCSRCKFQLRTKKGMKQWKKDHKMPKREEMI